MRSRLVHDDGIDRSKQNATSETATATTHKRRNEPNYEFETSETSHQQELNVPNEEAEPDGEDHIDVYREALADLGIGLFSGKY